MKVVDRAPRRSRPGAAAPSRPGSSTSTATPSAGSTSPAATPTAPSAPPRERPSPPSSAAASTPACRSWASWTPAAPTCARGWRASTRGVAWPGRSPTPAGSCPIVLVVTGACVSGPSLLLGLADLVVATDDAIAYVTGPATVEAMTGMVVSRAQLGGAPVLGGRAGVAHLRAHDLDEALALVADVLDLLPPNVSELPPVRVATDPADRRCDRAGAIVPDDANLPYDVRELRGRRRRRRRAPRAAGRLRPGPGDGARPHRRAARGRGGQPAPPPRRHPRHRGEPEGRPGSCAGATPSACRS